MALIAGQTASEAASSLLALLGEQRAAIVDHLRRHDDASVSELAEMLGISEVATRRHLGVLEDDGLIAARRVRQGRGRPASRYALTEAARALFPQRYDALAAEMFTYLTDTHGRDGLRAFLRWRMQREVDSLREAVTAEDLHGRLDQLASALSEAGFEASVTPDGGGFRLRQQHCTIEGIAREHPEVCAFEAASFSRVLGQDVVLSRRETLAGGGAACVCHVRTRTADAGSDPPPGVVTNHDDDVTTSAKHRTMSTPSDRVDRSQAASPIEVTNPTQAASPSQVVKPTQGDTP